MREEARRAGQVADALDIKVKDLLAAQKRAATASEVAEAKESKAKQSVAEAEAERRRRVAQSASREQEGDDEDTNNVNAATEKAEKAEPYPTANPRSS